MEDFDSSTLAPNEENSQSEDGTYEGGRGYGSLSPTLQTTTTTTTTTMLAIKGREKADDEEVLEDEDEYEDFVPSGEGEVSSATTDVKSLTEDEDGVTPVKIKKVNPKLVDVFRSRAR